MRQPNDVDDQTLELDDDAHDAEEPHITFDIASYPSDLTLSVLNEMWVNQDIIIPGFQRKFVWSVKQASMLIESFLMGLPVPQVFLYVNEENKSLVIDGQQRIRTIAYFLSGYFGEETPQGKRQVFRLQGLSPKSPYIKKRFIELADADQRKLKSSVLRAINIRQLNPKGHATSVYHIFERLNTGGTPLKQQEIRNCVFHGKLADNLIELNEDKNWRKIIGRSRPDKYQKDVELILRVFAFAFFSSQYDKPMKEFLNKVMHSERHCSSPCSQQLMKRFPQICERVIESLGEQPFHLRGPLNAAAIDSVMALILGHRGRLPINLAKRYECLKTDEKFIAATSKSTSDASVISQRFKVAREHLFG